MDHILIRHWCKRDVPQGLVVELIVFLLFINDRITAISIKRKEIILMYEL